MSVVGSAAHTDSFDISRVIEISFADNYIPIEDTRRKSSVTLDVIKNVKRMRMPIVGLIARFS